MQDLENIQLKQFKIVRNLNGAHVILVQDSGEGARISNADFLQVIIAQLMPSIEDGEWIIGDTATGVSAKARNIVIRKNDRQLEWKYDDEPLTQYRQLMPLSELTLKFADLTAEQRDALSLHFSDLTAEQILLLQKPAADAASSLETLTGNLESLVSSVNEAETERDASEQARAKAESARKETFDELIAGIDSANKDEFLPRISYLESHAVQVQLTGLDDDEVDLSVLHSR